MLKMCLCFLCLCLMFVFCNYLLWYVCILSFLFKYWSCVCVCFAILVCSCMCSIISSSLFNLCLQFLSHLIICMCPLLSLVSRLCVCVHCFLFSLCVYVVGFGECKCVSKHTLYFSCLLQLFHQLFCLWLYLFAFLYFLFISSLAVVSF